MSGAAPEPLTSGRAALLVAAKELRAAFRDRQTTLYTIVLPIALYPFLFWCLIQASLFVQGRRERTEVHVGVAVAADARVPEGLLDALANRPPAKDAAELDDAARARRAAIDRVRVGPVRSPLDAAAARGGRPRARTPRTKTKHASSRTPSCSCRARRRSKARRSRR